MLERCSGVDLRVEATATNTPRMVCCLVFFSKPSQFDSTLHRPATLLSKAVPVDQSTPYPSLPTSCYFLFNLTEDDTVQDSAGAVNNYELTKIPIATNPFTKNQQLLRKVSALAL